MGLTDNLDTRISRGRKAISLARQRGMDTSSWETELTKLEAVAQAQDVTRRTRRLLDLQGWCLWKCRTLGGEVIVVVRDEHVTGIPGGYPIYTEVELSELCQDSVTEATLRLVHEAKKLAGAKVTAEGVNNATGPVQLRAREHNKFQ